MIPCGKMRHVADCGVCDGADAMFHLLFEIIAEERLCRLSVCGAIGFSPGRSVSGKDETQQESGSESLHGSTRR